MKIPATQLQPNMLPLGTYNLTVTGVNWTANSSLGHAYQDLSGVWRLRGWLKGTSTSSSGFDIAIAGVTFKSGVIQSGSIAHNGATGGFCFATGSGGTISIIATANGTAWGVNFDFILESKPTWAE
jgi:hypothetical protein